MNSHAFYLTGPPITLDDISIKLLNNDTYPITLLDTSAVQLETIDVLGLGWYRLIGLPFGEGDTTLIIFKASDLTTVICRQNFRSRRSSLPTRRQACPPVDPNAPPSPLEMVTVYGYVKDINQNPLAGQTVKYKIEPAPQTVNDIILDKEYQSVLTSETGYFEFVIPGGLSITVIIPSAKFQKSGTLPFQGRVEATSLDME